MNDDVPRSAGFLGPPPPSETAAAVYADDVAALGYVMNVSRLWAHGPTLTTGLFDLLRESNATARLTMRERGLLVTACASAFGDSYCALAWANKLAKVADPQTAASVLTGDDTGLTAAESALVTWARRIARDPSGTTPDDVDELRAAGWTDAQILAITTFVALRLAFSTVNDALGALPDAQLRSTTPAAILDAVTFGRPIEDV